MNNNRVDPIENFEPDAIVSLNNTQVAEPNIPTDEYEPDVPRSQKFMYIIGMRPGITSRNLIALYFFSGLLISVAVFVISIQQFILQQYLHVPQRNKDKQLEIWVS